MSTGFKIFVIGLIIGLFGLVIWLKYKGQTQKVTDDFVHAKKGDVLNKIFVSGILVSEKEVALKSQMSGILEKVYVETGQVVRKGQSIAKVRLYPDPNKLEMAKKNVRVAEVDFDIAEARYLRNKKLFNKGIIPREEYEQFERRWKISIEELSYAKKQLQIAKHGFSDAKENKSDIIFSTISGTVLEIYLKEGSSVIERNTFNEGSNIASIANMKEIIFKGKVAEKDIEYFTSDISLKVVMNSFNKKVLDAQLVKISPKGVVENGITKFDIECKVQIDQSDAISIRSGYTAVAEIVLEKAENVLTLDEKYIHFEQDSTFVYLLDGDKKKYQSIVTGISDGINVQILSGLDENSKVYKFSEK